MRHILRNWLLIIYYLKKKEVAIPTKSEGKKFG